MVSTHPPLPGLELLEQQVGFQSAVSGLHPPGSHQTRSPWRALCFSVSRPLHAAVYKLLPYGLVLQGLGQCHGRVCTRNQLFHPATKQMPCRGIGAGVGCTGGLGQRASWGYFLRRDGASCHSWVYVRAPHLLQTAPWALQKGGISMAVIF